MARWWPPRCDDGDDDDDAPVVEGNRNGYAAVLWIFILSDPELGASIISTPLLENQPLYRLRWLALAVVACWQTPPISMKHLTRVRRRKVRSISSSEMTMEDCGFDDARILRNKNRDGIRYWVIFHVFILFEFGFWFVPRVDFFYTLTEKYWERHIFALERWMIMGYHTKWSQVELGRVTFIITTVHIFEVTVLDVASFLSIL